MSRRAQTPRRGSGLSMASRISTASKFCGGGCSTAVAVDVETAPESVVSYVNMSRYHMPCFHMYS